ncbi:MAG: lysophospholipid acyltransferase family protein [Proteobacteria bacterium]|nr:lysophospholipid acyltransferase family protein [Pseudomonadota bacterium]
MRNSTFQDDGPFQLPPATGTPFQTALISALHKPLKKLLRLGTLNTMYARANTRPASPEGTPDFLIRALDELAVSYKVSHDDLQNIPRQGPLLIVSNHPFGVVEGLVLARILMELRPDVKILANHLLATIPEMRPLLIELDPFGGKGSATRNMAGLRASLGWLKQGGALVVFPAGEVSSLALKRRMVADPPWQRGVAAIARKASVPVLPVFFEGRNSALFQAAGLVHPRLRTLLLPRENLGHCGQELELSIGAAIPPEKIAGLTSDEEASAYLRFRCHLLRNRGQQDLRKATERTQAHKALAAQKPHLARLAEIKALPAERILSRSEPFIVFEAKAQEIPAILHEVSRLRESTFRRVGEGTGESLDTDRFDAHYRHLVLWNERDREVAGAYRFAGTDEVLAAQGAGGMYTASQFRIKHGFWDRLNPALELGRSFIRPRYQKSYQPLLLLWKGLAEYVVRNPRYSVLFGCVSISGDYSPLSREIMMTFLRRHSFNAELAKLVRPTRVAKGGSLSRLDLSVPDSAFRDPGDINDLVAEVESGRGIPVLLRQYLKLGGRIAAFNMDPDFGNCLDGLITVDLRATDERVLARFMGSENARRFLAHHSMPPAGQETDRSEDCLPPRAA